MFKKDDYQIKNTEYGKCLIRSDGTNIPFETMNRDYQEYLQIMEK